MREGHGARSRLAARRTSWWAGRHHHCPCCGSSEAWRRRDGRRGGLGGTEPLPRALTGAVYDPVDELLLAWPDHQALECEAKHNFQDTKGRVPNTQPRNTQTRTTRTQHKGP